MGGLSAAPLPVNLLLWGTSRRAKKVGGTLVLSLRPSRTSVGRASPNVASRGPHAASPGRYASTSRHHSPRLCWGSSYRDRRGWIAASFRTPLWTRPCARGTVSHLHHSYHPRTGRGAARTGPGGLRDNLRCSSVCLKPGFAVSPGTVIGHGHEPLRRQHFLSDNVRGLTSLPLPAFRLHGVDVPLSVDGSARAARFSSSADAVLYTHECEDPTLVGDWWMGDPVLCLVARSARPLSDSELLTWNFDAQGEPPFTTSHAEARAWRQSGYHTARCSCNMPRDWPFDRFIRVADSPDTSEGSDW